MEKDFRIESFDMSTFKSLLSMEYIPKSKEDLAKKEEDSAEKEEAGKAIYLNYERINLFIGPNNHGKSNVIKYFFAIKERRLNKKTDTFMKLPDYFGELKDIVSLENGTKICIQFTEEYLDDLVIYNNDKSIPLEDIGEDFLSSLNFIDNERKDIDLHEIWGRLNQLKEDYCLKMKAWLTDILDEPVKRYI